MPDSTNLDRALTHMHEKQPIVAGAKAHFLHVLQ
jgi:hypothetical protein